MTQSQFMYDLMIELEGIPDEEKLLVMNDYTQLFSDRASDGMSEESIIAGLCSPKEIANGYKIGNPIPIEGVDSVLNDIGKGKKTPLSVFKFILLIPACVLYEAAAVTFGLLLLLAALVLCAAAALASVAAFMSAPLSSGFIVLGIGGIAITFAFVMLCAAVFKGAVGAVVKFPKFMGRVLHNRTKARAEK